MTITPCSMSSTATMWIAFSRRQRGDMPVDRIGNDRQVRAGAIRGEIEERRPAGKDLDEMDLIAEGEQDVLERGLEAESPHDLQLLFHQLAVVGAGDGQIEVGARRLRGERHA